MNDTELEARGSDTAAADAETKRSNGAKRARLLGMIGLAKRAGRLICGTDAVLSAVSSAKKPQLVIASDDISERTKKQLSDKCAHYGVKLLTIPVGRDALASAIGKKNSFVSAAAVTDGSFAEQISFLANS